MTSLKNQPSFPDYNLSKTTSGVQTDPEDLLSASEARGQGRTHATSIGNDDLGLFSDFAATGVNNPTKDSSSSTVEESSRLLLIQFCITDLAVELQSRGKSIAELQVTGVRASLTRRPYDTNVTLSVMSLLLVDALQVKR